MSSQEKRTNEKGKQIPLLWQFIKFGLVGITNTVVSLAVYYLVLFIREDLYLAGSILGTIISIANAFIWNDRYVFKGQEQGWKKKLKRLGKTYISYGATSFLSVVLVWVEVSIIGLSKAIAPIINLLITIPLNFVMNKIWVFASKRA